MQDLVDAAAGLRIALPQDPFDHVGRHFFDDIHRVIDVQFIQNVLQLPVAERADQHFLLVRFHFSKSLSSQLFWQQAVYDRQRFFRYFSEDLRNIHRVFIPQKITDLCVFFILQKS